MPFQGHKHTGIRFKQGSLLPGQWQPDGAKARLFAASFSGLRKAPMSLEAKAAMRLAPEPRYTARASVG